MTHVLQPSSINQMLSQCSEWQDLSTKPLRHSSLARHMTLLVSLTEIMSVEPMIFLCKEQFRVGWLFNQAARQIAHWRLKQTTTLTRMMQRRQQCSGLGSVTIQAYTRTILLKSMWYARSRRSSGMTEEFRRVCSIGLGLTHNHLISLISALNRFLIVDRIQKNRDSMQNLAGPL